MRIKSKTKLKKSFYYIVPFFSILFTIFIIELFFIIFYPVPYSIEKNMYFEEDPFLGYRLKPNSIGYFQNGIPARANSNGHRDYEINKQAQFRILVLGDSFTVGAGVLQDDAYPQILENMLNKNSKTIFEVINAGVGGWQPFQYAQYYEYYGYKFEPDMILVGFFVGNDTYDQMKRVEQSNTAVMGRRVSRRAASRKFVKLILWAYENINLVRFVLNRGTGAKDFTRKNCQDFTKQYIEIQRSRINSHLKKDENRFKLARNSVYQISRIKKIAAQHSIPVIVILIPDENQINPYLQKSVLKDKVASKYDFEMPQTMLVDMFNDVGIQTINLLSYFKKDPRCLYMNDTHWTPEGHKLAASFIYKEIIGYILK